MHVRPIRLLVLTAAALLIAAGVRPVSGAGVKLAVPSDAWPTIQSALDALPDGGTVTVAAGVYPEALRLASRSNVRLIGKNAIVDSDGADVALELTGCQNPLVSGFVFRDASKVGVLFSGCAGGVISKCRIEDQAGDGLRFEGCSGVVVSACAFLNIAGDGLGGLPGTTGTRVTKCLFRNIGNHGIALFGSTDPGAAATTISGNDLSGIARHGIDTGGANFLVAKNRVADCGWDAIYAASFTVATSATVVTGNTTTGGQRGILVSGDHCGVSKNRIGGAGYGIVTSGTDILVSGNSVTDPGNGGVVAHGTGSRFEKTKVSGSGGAGFHFVGGANEVLGCSASDCDGPGFLVESTGNTFTGNKAAECAGYPAWDLTGAGNNTWTKNRFEVIYEP
ncbi:MAG: right-handed parallel beta-helix repeat-containing protein [Planctomycetes bacterium]|jgi:hypothetical protein|nr:right-handed parallel beta-helix repeat-containing protein [Planctomycetota bacterium]